VGGGVKRLTDLTFLFTVVAVVEVAYALVTLAPPGLLGATTGWVLTADGQWVTKLLCVALAAQAAIAWTMRRTPTVGVAAALAFYQLASGTVDWVIWLTLRDAFSTVQAQVGIVAAIPTHYAIGVLLIVAVTRARTEQL
jgi:hypothetical protein